MGGRVGWVWGVSLGRGDGGHEWLTVPGSTYETPTLAATAAEAVPAYTVAAILARVIETWHPGVTGPRGMAYRVIERWPLCTAGGRVAPFVLGEGLNGEQPAGAMCEVECPDCEAVVVVHVARDRTATVPDHTRVGTEEDLDAGARPTATSEGATRA